MKSKFPLIILTLLFIVLGISLSLTLGVRELFEAKPKIQWEYKMLDMENKEDLNEYGKEGWELVSVVAEQGAWMFFFKRQKVSK